MEVPNWPSLRTLGTLREYRRGPDQLDSSVIPIHVSNSTKIVGHGTRFGHRGTGWHRPGRALDELSVNVVGTRSEITRLAMTKEYLWPHSASDSSTVLTLELGWGVHAAAPALSIPVQYAHTVVYDRTTWYSRTKPAQACLRTPHGLHPAAHLDRSGINMRGVA